MSWGKFGVNIRNIWGLFGNAWDRFSNNPFCLVIRLNQKRNKGVWI